MQTTIKLFLVLIMSTIVNASSHMVPIIMGDIITFVPQGNSIKTVKEVYPASLYLDASAPTVKVNIEGPLSGDQDWVGIFKKGAEITWANTLAWTWVGDQKNNLNIDTIKNEMGFLSGGEYEVRLFFHNSVQTEASYSFYMLKAGRPPLLAEEPEVSPNASVSVLINTEHLSGNQDWVGIYHKDDASTWENVVAWNWAENGGVTLDKIKRDMPVGEYEIRLFNNNGFDVVETTNFFVVAGDNQTNHIYPPDTTLTSNIVNRIQRPAHKFDSYIDTAFDNTVTRTVTRVTDREVDNKGFNSHQYPKQGSAWNSDMSLLRLTGRIYDAETLREIPLTKDKTGGEVNTLMKSPESGSSGIRWSKHNPNVLYIMSSQKKFYKLTINATKTAVTEELIIDLSNYNMSNFNIGENEGNIDYADKYVVLSATNANDRYVTLLDIKEKHLVWEPKKVVLSKDNMDWVSISPSGNYILVASYNDDLHDGTSQIELYNRNFEKIRVLANRSEHGDIGYAPDGNEMFVQFHSGGVGVFGFVLNNNPQYEEPIRLLDSNYGGGHISCRNYKRKGWCYISTREHGYREIFALKLDSSQTVQRFAKSYARGAEDPILGDANNYHYATYPTGVPSPDGTRALFWSDYGNSEEYLYVYKDNEGWHTTDHYYSRDTYQVRISE